MAIPHLLRYDWKQKQKKRRRRWRPRKQPQILRLLSLLSIHFNILLLLLLWRISYPIPSTKIRGRRRITPPHKPRSRHMKIWSGSSVIWAVQVEPHHILCQWVPTAVARSLFERAVFASLSLLLQRMQNKWNQTLHNIMIWLPLLMRDFQSVFFSSDWLDFW